MLVIVILKRTTLIGDMCNTFNNEYLKKKFLYFSFMLLISHPLLHTIFPSEPRMIESPPSGTLLVLQKREKRTRRIMQWLSKLPPVLNQSEQVKRLILTSVRQGSVTLPQGRTANSVNSSVIYHILVFMYIPRTLKKRETAVLAVVVLPKVAYSQRKTGDLSKHLTDVGL